MAKKNNTDKAPRLTADGASKMMRDSLDVIESRFTTIFTMLENQNILMGEIADDAETLSALGMAGAKQAKKRKKARDRAGAEAVEAQSGISDGADTGGAGNAVVDFEGLDLDAVANDLGALGHPVRLEIVQLCLTEPRRVREIAETLGHGTTGQIYHHLRQLTSAGWLTSVAGNRYTVNEERAGALAVILGALR